LGYPAIIIGQSAPSCPQELGHLWGLIPSWRSWTQERSPCCKRIQPSLVIGGSSMSGAEHRKPCESRGSRTVLGARGGAIPPRDSLPDARTAQKDRRDPSAITTLYILSRCSGLSASPTSQIEARSQRPAQTRTPRPANAFPDSRRTNTEARGDLAISRIPRAGHRHRARSNRD
jgi:hypothetical protein